MKNVWWWVIGGVVVVGVVFAMYQQQSQGEASTIKIGVILPMTGIAANYGEHQYNAIKLAVNEINATGGVLDKKLDIVMEDDATDPKKTVSAFQKVTEINQVPVVIGGAWDFLANAILPLVKEKGIPTITASAPPDSLQNPPANFFATFSPIFIHQPVVEKYLRNTAGNKIAIIYINNAWGSAHRDMYKKAVIATGKTLIAEVELPNFDNNDIQSEITRLKSMHPDIVLTAVNLVDPKLVIEKNKDLGLNAQIFGHDNIIASYLNKGIRKDALKEVVVYRLARPSTDFGTKYRKDYGTEPISEADKAYDAVYVIVKAIELSGDISPQGITHGLRQIKDYAGASGPINFSNSNWPTQDTARLEIFDGENFVSYLD